MSCWEWLQVLRPLQVNLDGRGRVALGMDCRWARISAQFLGRKVTLCPESRRAVAPPAPPIANGRHSAWTTLSGARAIARTKLSCVSVSILGGALRIAKRLFRPVRYPPWILSPLERSSVRARPSGRRKCTGSSSGNRSIFTGLVQRNHWRTLQRGEDPISQPQNRVLDYL